VSDERGRSIYSSYVLLPELFLCHDALMKDGKPVCGIVSHFRSNLIQQPDVVGRAGEDIQQIRHAS
jgi:hypothetical protein